MSVGQALMTAEEFLEIAEQCDAQLDLMRGEVMELSRGTAIHGACCTTVAALLWNWAKPGNHGRVASNDRGIVTERNPDTVRGPDVYFIRSDRLSEGQLPQGWLQIPPDLCIEVLSPSDRWGELARKIDEFLTRGVPEVWVIDPAKHLVQIHVAVDDTLTVLGEGDTLTSVRLPEFELAVSELFAGC